MTITYFSYYFPSIAKVPAHVGELLAPLESGCKQRYSYARGSPLATTTGYFRRGRGLALVFVCAGAHTLFQRNDYHGDYSDSLRFNATA